MNAEARLMLSRSKLAFDYSFEITAADVASLEQAGATIEPGTQVSITFLPGNSLSMLIEAAASVRRLGLAPVPHIAAHRLSTKSELEEFLQELSRQAFVDHVFVIGGDTVSPQGPYKDALAIINAGPLTTHGIKTVGIAGYPDGHPSIPDATLWRAMREKRLALMGSGLEAEIVTQFCFDADPVLEWIEEVRRAGISDLIRIGIPGPASVRSLLRFATRCGVGATTKVMAKYGLSLTGLMDSAGPERLLDDLQSRLDPKFHGNIKLHLYPFGGIGRAIRFMTEFSAI